MQNNVNDTNEFPDWIKNLLLGAGATTLGLIALRSFFKEDEIYIPGVDMSQYNEIMDDKEFIKVMRKELEDQAKARGHFDKLTQLSIDLELS